MGDGTSAAAVTVRPFVDEDLPEVLEVLRAALGETPLLRRTQELFEWKHFDNPFGRSIILLAESEGRIAGVRAFMRWELMTTDGNILRCVRAVDTATHPDFMRRGIFRTLTNAAIEAAVDDGVDMVFNTPNDKSGAGYLKMGWVAVGDIGVMVSPSYRMIRKSATDDLPVPAEFLRDPKPAKELPRVDRRPVGLRTPRTPEYLQWRFDGHPTARYCRVDGGGSVAVVRPNHRDGRRELVVSDVLGPQPRRAIAAARRASRAEYLAGWFSEGSPERSGALRALMLPVPKVTALTLVARPLRELPVDVSTLSAWDLSLGDLELL